MKKITQIGTIAVSSVLVATLFAGIIAPLLLLPKSVIAQFTGLESSGTGEFLPGGGSNISSGMESGAAGATTCLGGLAGAAGTATGWFSGGLAVNDPGAITGLMANCIQSALSMISNSITASGIGYLVTKSKLDAIATGIIKTAVKLVRDMVVRWILTGRFEGPVFSGSFSIDAAKTAENASRIFLSRLFGINFCAGIEVPTIRDFIFAEDFGLSCTVPGLSDRFSTDEFYQKIYRHAEYAQTHPIEIEFDEFNAQNDAIYTYTEIRRLKDEAVARALIARAAEYQAGQGFLDIKNAVGEVITPGSVVKGLALESIITSPQRQLDVANTVQQAIVAILEAAVRVTIEKGLSGATGSSR